MDPLNYCKKHRRNKPQVSSQPETSSSFLQNCSSLTAPLWLHSFLPRPADPSPAQVCPTLLSRGPGSLPSPGVMLHLWQPCPKGTLLVFGHFVPQEPPLPSAPQQHVLLQGMALPRGSKLLSSTDTLAFFSRLGPLQMAAKPSDVSTTPLNLNSEPGC